MQELTESWSNENTLMAQKKWFGKVKGPFEETQFVYADTKEEAEKLLSENAGETIDRTSIAILEVSDIEEVES